MRDAKSAQAGRGGKGSGLQADWRKHDGMGWKVALRGFVAAGVGCVLLNANIANPAVAGGETRTLNFVNPHTGEDGSFVYLVNGSYDSAVLDKMNWFLRDWHINESTKMDPKLFDIIWQVYQESGSSLPIEVLSAYRSPQTNAMLRARSRQVAEHSQHMEGRAIDAHFQDVTVAKARDIAMHMQAGGVGFYPVGGTPWVHIDSGSIRYWPRMSRDALARIFPDGKTVFIPADGQPMSGFEEAKAEIEQRGGQFQTASSGTFNLFTWLFSNHSGGADDAEESGPDSVVTHGGNAVAVAKAEKTPPAAATAVAQAAPAAAPTPDAAPVTVASVDPANKSDATVDAVDPPPMPHRRPADLDVALAPALPPSRPRDLALAFASPAPDDTHQDLIRALLEKNALPTAITRGIALPPTRALALADVSSTPDPEASAKLAKAAALPVPMPAPRPAVRKPAVVDESATASIKKPAAPGPRAILSAAADPDDMAFGALPVAPAAPTAGESALGAALKAAAP